MKNKKWQTGGKCYLEEKKQSGCIRIPILRLQYVLFFIAKTWRLSGAFQNAEP